MYSMLKPWKIPVISVPNVHVTTAHAVARKTDRKDKNAKRILKRFETLHVI